MLHIGQLRALTLLQRSVALISLELLIVIHFLVRSRSCLQLAKIVSRSTLVGVAQILLRVGLPWSHLLLAYLRLWAANEVGRHIFGGLETLVYIHSSVDFVWRGNLQIQAVIVVLLLAINHFLMLV